VLAAADDPVGATEPDRLHLWIAADLADQRTSLEFAVEPVLAVDFVLLGIDHLAGLGGGEVSPVEWRGDLAT
jgi:hypothetical protein